VVNNQIFKSVYNQNARQFG